MADVTFKLSADGAFWTSGNPGDGRYATREEVPTDIIYRCPGCGEIVFCTLKPDPRTPAWEMTGTREAPTLSPSIIHDKAKGGCGWHGWLRDGVFREC